MSVKGENAEGRREARVESTVVPWRKRTTETYPPQPPISQTTHLWYLANVLWEYTKFDLGFRFEHRRRPGSSRRLGVPSDTGHPRGVFAEEGRPPPPARDVSGASTRRSRAGRAQGSGPR